MIKNLILLTGRDTYRLNNRLKFYKEKFREKYENGEISFLNKENSYRFLENIIFTPNIFGGKRLAICDNFWDSEKYEKAEKNKFFEKLQNYQEECSLMIVLPKPDKRLKFSKFLLKNARIEKFNIYEENELIRWIEKFTIKNNGSISRENSQKLLRRCGNDLWVLDSEIRKLVFAGNGEISAENVEKLTRANPRLEIWDFLKNLSECNSLAAILKFRDLLVSGVSVQQIFSMVQREIRIHAQLVNGLDRNLSERDIAIETKSRGIFL